MPKVAVNGIEVNYMEAGEGFPIVLVHGFTGNLRNWALTVPSLMGRFRTISLDLRGHGHSHKPTLLEEYTLDLLAEDVYQVVRHLGVEDCYLMGHSMGGMVAQHLILTHPELFRALVLVDTAAERPVSSRMEERLHLMKIAREKGLEAVWEEQLRITPPPDTVLNNAVFMNLWREQFLLTSREAYVYCLENVMSRRPLLDDLRNVTVPTLIVVGEKDEPFVVPSHNMHKAIPGSELVVIPGVGHTPQIEKAVEFNSVLSGFLSRVHEGVAAG